MLFFSKRELLDSFQTILRDGEAKRWDPAIELRLYTHLFGIFYTLGRCIDEIYSWRLSAESS